MGQQYYHSALLLIWLACGQSPSVGVQVTHTQEYRWLVRLSALPLNDLRVRFNKRCYLHVHEQRGMCALSVLFGCISGKVFTHSDVVHVYPLLSLFTAFFYLLCRLLTGLCVYFTHLGDLEYTCKYARVSGVLWEQNKAAVVDKLNKSYDKQKKKRGELQCDARCWFKALLHFQDNMLSSASLFTL